MMPMDVRGTDDVLLALYDLPRPRPASIILLPVITIADRPEPITQPTFTAPPGTDTSVRATRSQ